MAGVCNPRVRVTDHRVRVINPRVRALCDTAVRMTSQLSCHDVRVRVMMTALYCFIPWFLKHRIQNRNEVNRAISSQDVKQCHED